MSYATLEFHLTLVRMTIIKKSSHQCWQMQAKESPFILIVEYKLVIRMETMTEVTYKRDPPNSPIYHYQAFTLKIPVNISQRYLLNINILQNYSHQLSYGANPSCRGINKENVTCGQDALFLSYKEEECFNICKKMNLIEENHIK